MSAEESSAGGRLGSAGDHRPSPATDLDRLARWVAAGGTWRVVGRSRTAVTVALLTCDGGEEMGRITSADGDVARHVAEHAPGD